MDEDGDRRERDNHEQRLANFEQWVFNTLCPNLAREKQALWSAMEEEFEEIIIRICKKKNNTSEFNFDDLRSFYCNFRDDVTNLWSLQMFCTFVFKLLLKLNCSSQQLVIKVIYLYHHLLKEYETMGVCSNCMDLNYPKHHYYEEFYFEETESILGMINEVPGSTYELTNREFYSKLTTDAIYEGDYIFLQFLIKYGVSYFPDDQLNQTKIELRKLYKKYRFLTLGVRDEDELVNEFVESFIKQKFMTGVQNLNMRRIFLTIKVITISLRKRMEDKYFPDYVKCLNLFALTLSEPVISKKDVEDFLGLMFPDDAVFVAETFSLFKEVFPESPSLPSPRSLKHLCRCKVRNCIQILPTLTTVLSGLPIPESMKDYLLFLLD